MLLLNWFKFLFHFFAKIGKKKFKTILDPTHGNMTNNITTTSYFTSNQYAPLKVMTHHFILGSKCCVMLGTVYYCNTNPTTISHFTLIGDMNQLTKLPFKGGYQTQEGRWQRRCLLPGIPEAEQSSCCLPCKTFLGLHPCISIQNSFPLIPYEVVFMIFIYPIVMQTISLMSLSALSLVLNIMYLQGKL